MTPHTELKYKIRQYYQKFQSFVKLSTDIILAPLCFAVRQQLECEQRSRLCEREQRFIELEHELRGASEILLVKLIGDPAQVRDYHFYRL